MNWQDWFISNGSTVVTGIHQFGLFVGFTVEEMYEMFKERLLAEIEARESGS